MSFASPHLLWLLLVPVGLIAWELTRRRRAAGPSAHPKILRAEIAAQHLEVVREPAKASGVRLRPWLAAGLVFTIIALARPQWGRLEEPVFDQSREILLAIDLSRSMLSPDVKPSRLDRAKLLVQALLEKLKGERVGLVVFSGTAFLQSPLSADYEILREFLPALNPDFLPEGGTNYRALIDTSLDAFGSSASADRFLIILSDGEANDDNWRSGIDELKKKGIRVIGLGVGTANGSMIPDGAGGFVKDQRGAVVLSKLESKTLQELATATNGTYRDASGWVDLSSLINETVNAGKKGDFADKNTVRYVERFQWPLALALWCLCASFYYEFPVRPRPREIGLRRGATAEKPAASVTKTGVAAALLVGFACFSLVAPNRVRAAVKVAPPSAQPGTPAAPAAEPATPTAPGDPATLGKIVGRLSQQDSLSAPDLSEFAHETVNWGRRLKEAGQAVPDGPVRDALAAVDELESKGSKLTDWSQLRKELEDLRQPPPEKKTPPPSQNQQHQQQKQNNQQQKQQNQQSQSQPSQADKNQSEASQNQNQPKPNQGDAQKNEPQKSDTANQPAGASPQNENKPNQPFAFGDMKKEPPPPPPSDVQKVGGEPDKKEAKEPIDPALALPMQKLDRLKNEDSPGKLFQLMQSERNAASQKKPAKDW